jgi:hypothetical protein
LEELADLREYGCVIDDPSLADIVKGLMNEGCKKMKMNESKQSKLAKQNN